jgi:hypothetical protein
VNTLLLKETSRIIAYAKRTTLIYNLVPSSIRNFGCLLRGRQTKEQGANINPEITIRDKIARNNRTVEYLCK